MRTPFGRRRFGFTLVEMMVAISVGSVLATGLMLYSSSALRLISRNLALNRSHNTARGAAERLLSDLHGAASTLQLASFDGTTFSDLTPTATSEKDALSGKYLSTRGNAVRYFRPAGGPCKLLSDGSGNTTVPVTATTLRFEFGPLVGGRLPYVPGVGDKLKLPLIAREFTITAVGSAPSAASTRGTVTISSALGFILYTSGTTPAGVTNPVTTGYFFDSVGYSVWNSELRYHPTYPPVAAADTVRVREDVTSPKPFAVLFPTAASVLTDNLNLRVSLEAYDRSYGARVFQNGTTTMVDVVPLRTRPATLNSN